jgi:mRNA interferase RelE/StbE
MNVEIRPSVTRDFKKIPGQDRVKIYEALNKLKANKTLNEIKNLKKIEDTENQFRLRIGRYRVKLTWLKNEQILIVEAIKLRKDIYKKR